MERKITSKSACSLTSGEIAKLGREKKTPLYVIMGIINGRKIVSTAEYGESMGFTGTFESVDAKTGETKQAPVYWPPRFFGEILNSQLTAVEGERGATVKFAAEVGVQPDDSTQLGYVYYVDPVSEPNRNDPFAELRQVALKKVPALAALAAPAEDDGDGEDEAPAKTAKGKAKK